MKSLSKTEVKKLKATMALADEYLAFMDDRLCYSISPKGSDLVKWVDTRKLAYHNMREYWYKFGKKYLNEV